MPPLSSDHRKLLEKTVIAARVAGVKGAEEALHALAVGEAKPFDSMDEARRDLRRRLRARGRQLGDVRSPNSTQTIRRLVQEIAYEHWHRMLFARFLSENQLLIEPDSKVAISMDEVEEIAREEGIDSRELAASYAQRSLPQIFRTDDPVFEVVFAPETRVKLDQLLDTLPAEVFTGDDALGWVYQFWQSAEKDEVNARVKSGEKITGETLPAVTQLFTEHYMVQFLLHNTIGAWHAGNVLNDDQRASAGSEQELRDSVCLRAVDRYDFEYLRFVREAKDGEDLNTGTGAWRPAAGAYDGWPKTAADLHVLDPCCGSGHFLVAAFDLLVRLRIAEEGLETEDAIRAVLSDNLFGLELDPRCTQIAAFNLAFAAWKLAGKPINLPALNIACSGIGPESTKDEWLKLADDAGEEAWEGISAGNREFVRNGLIDLHETFSKAPELGSLIDPADRSTDLITADFETLKPFLDRVLAAEVGDNEAHERAVAARGMAAAAELLTQDYTLVITNVPYLGRKSHSDALRTFVDAHYHDARADVATVFTSRGLKALHEGGTIAHVLRDNWLFQDRYKNLRKHLLKRLQWNAVARLGSGAFEALGGHVVNAAMVVISRQTPRAHHFAGVDVAIEPSPRQKSDALQVRPIRLHDQSKQERNPDSRLILSVTADGEILKEVANSWQGIKTSDDPRFTQYAWERSSISEGWHPYLRAPDSAAPFCGRKQIILWEDGDGAMTEVCQENAQFRGRSAWGRRGVAIHTMSGLGAVRYEGELFAADVSVIDPKNQELVPALWELCRSEEYVAEVRKLDRALRVTNTALIQVSADLDEWTRRSADHNPNGLPEPQSDDPTQWLFHGHPERAEAHAALQVGVARLVGYRWPAELDEDMRLAPEARELVNRCAELSGHADDDGIVCLTSLRGEASAANRLRALLRDAFDDEWTSMTEARLLKAAGDEFDKGKACKGLDEWLREKCFEHHCKLFHHRPFVWHIWDGRKDGFSALVNYHKLAGPEGVAKRTLETLTYSYLREWILRQEQGIKDGTEGADGRLAAAQKLKDELEKILKGEPPYDLFVRWKSLHEQPIGWEPDINDGVRLNIRPLLCAEDVGKKGAGVLRWKPNVKWTKDRGKEPQSLRPREQFPWFWKWDEKTEDFAGGAEFDGARWNDLHYTIAAKQAARAEAEQTEGSTT